MTVHLCSAAEEEAAKAAAAEAKKAREAEKKVIKKQRQLLRAIAEGGPRQQRLMSEGEKIPGTSPSTDIHIHIGTDVLTWQKAVHSRH